MGSRGRRREYLACTACHVWLSISGSQVFFDEYSFPKGYIALYLSILSYAQTGSTADADILP